MKFLLLWSFFYTTPTLEFVAAIPILHLRRQMDWSPQLHWLPIDRARLPWWTFRIGSMMSIWRNVALTHLLAPGLPNQSHMLGALSSFCCCGPAALWFSNFQFTMPSPLLSHCSGTKKFISSTNSASSVQQTAPDLPNQGCCAFPWCTIQSNLRPPPYKVQLLLFLCWTLTYPSYYITLTAPITVWLKPEDGTGTAQSTRTAHSS